MKNKLFLILGLFLLFINKTNALSINWNFWSNDFWWDIDFWRSSWFWLDFDFLWPILWLIWIIIVFNIFKGIFWWNKLIKTSSLVLTKLEINEDKNEIVKIEWRKGGIWNFILSKLNIENKYLFLVNKKEKIVSLDEYGLNWNKKTVISLVDISSISVSNHKKLSLVISWGLIIFLIMASWAFFTGLLLWIILAYYYYITKSSRLEFDTGGTTKMILSYSSSVIEWINLSIDKFKEIEEIMINLKNK